MHLENSKEAFWHLWRLKIIFDLEKNTTWLEYAPVAFIFMFELNAHNEKLSIFEIIISWIVEEEEEGGGA